MFNIKQTILYQHWVALVILAWVFLIIMIIAVNIVARSRSKVLINIVRFIFMISVGFLLCMTLTPDVISKPLHQIASPRTYLSSIQYKGRPQSISINTEPSVSDGLNVETNQKIIHHQRIVHHQLKGHTYGVNVKVYRRYWWYKNRFDQNHFIPSDDDDDNEIGKKNYTTEIKVYYVPRNIKWNEN